MTPFFTLRQVFRQQLGHTARVRSLVALLSILGCGVVSCGETRPPNILVIVVDTLRADRLGAYGNPNGLTPFLDELAQRGTVFVNAYASASWTVPSVASLMTSRYSAQHHVVGFGSRLADDEFTFAEALQPLRYLSGGFSANRLLSQRYGFAQGFDYWRSDEQSSKGLAGVVLRQQAVQWLDDTQWAAERSPALLYLQFMEPHAPYDPPEPYCRQAHAGEPAAVTAAFQQKLLNGGMGSLTRRDFAEIERLYDGDVAHVDAEIRDLYADLERRGFLDNAIVIVTADHGEEFWEHGNMYHGKTLFDESVRVPLILIAPGYRAGQRVEQSVSLLDVAPTLVDLVGLPAEARFEGHSLVPLLTGSLLTRLASFGGRQRSERPDADVILELPPKSGPKYDNRRHVQGIRRQSIKLLIDRDGLPEVYDLTGDPAETAANPASLQTMATTLAAALHEATAALNSRAAVAVAPVELDEATKEKLRALGYQP
jgi:arylsulfatase A-like enzyme